MARPIGSVSPNIVLRIDSEDKAILNQLMKLEKLNRSDVIRRAIRDYAKKLGIECSPNGLK